MISPGQTDMDRGQQNDCKLKGLINIHCGITITPTLLLLPKILAKFIRLLRTEYVVSLDFYDNIFLYSSSIS